MRVFYEPYISNGSQVNETNKSTVRVKFTVRDKSHADAPLQRLPLPHVQNVARARANATHCHSNATISVSIRGSNNFSQLEIFVNIISFDFIMNSYLVVVT